MPDDPKPPTDAGFPPNAVHLVRTTQQITMQLSQMADQKASILMGATFVVFTLAIGQARAGAGALAMPLTILATFSFLSALLAVSAVLPRVGKAPPVVYKDGKDHSNILFFGRFSQMDEDDYIAAVKARLRSEEREAIIARVELGLSYQELADALGKPSADAARKAAERALVRLAEEMKER